MTTGFIETRSGWGRGWVRAGVLFALAARLAIRCVRSATFFRSKFFYGSTWNAISRSISIGGNPLAGKTLDRMLLAEKMPPKKALFGCACSFDRARLWHKFPVKQGINREIHRFRIKYAS